MVKTLKLSSEGEDLSLLMSTYTCMSKSFQEEKPLIRVVTEHGITDLLTLPISKDCVRHYCKVRDSSLHNL